MNGTSGSDQRHFVFGIYPGGAAGGDTGLRVGAPDHFESVMTALYALRGSATALVVRCYDSFQDAGSRLWSSPCAPEGFARYASRQTPLDLVLQYRSEVGDVSGYLNFVRDRIRQYAPLLYSVQITEEANFTNGPSVIDGPYPNVCTALTEGVQAAKLQLRSLGYPQVKVGFNCTPTFGPAADFWARLVRSGTDVFPQALDYVGLDFFPDVFRRVASDGEPGDLKSSVLGVLESMRKSWLPSAGIPDRVAIHITEHGWPTSAGRSPDRQSKVIEQTIRTVHSNRERLNIGGYSLFALRDVALETPENCEDLFSFFGIMLADYRPKPSFEMFRRLIQSLGS